MDSSNDSSSYDLSSYSTLTHQNTSSWSCTDYAAPRPQSHADESIWDSLKAVQWSQDRMTPFRKDFYRPHPAVTSRTEAEVEAYKRDKGIHTDNPRLRPVCRFEESGLPQDLVTLMEKAGFTGPTPIQSQGWPIALSGKDVVGIAQTGSGKTLSFVLPAVVHIRDQPPLQVSSIYRKEMDP